MKPLFKDVHRIHDPVWHVQVAMLVAIALQLALPDHYSISRYIIPLAEVVLLVSLSFTTPKRQTFSSRLRRANVLALIVLTSVANTYSLAVILDKLLVNGVVADGRGLILSAVNIFITNIIIFALWYWEMDGGGPGARQSGPKHDQDFLFPLDRNQDYKHPDWRPTFVDYLYTSATNGVNFAPADAVPVSRRAKLLMLLQSMLSLVTIALVVSRAIGILN